MASAKCGKCAASVDPCCKGLYYTMRTNLPKTLDQLILVNFTKYLVNVLKFTKYLVNVHKIR